MGKHSALDGATVHPLVADALQRRQHSSLPGRPANVVQHQAGDARSTATGWPSAAPAGGGLGWPGAEPVVTAPAAPVEHPDDDGSVLAVLDAAAAAPEPPARRTGWRRFFGGGHSSTRPTTAA